MEMAIYPNMIFSPYGEYWRQMRKICVTELLSAPRVRSFKSIREEEARGLVDNMRSLSCSPFNLSEKIFAFSNSIISKAAVGRRCKQQEAFIALLKESVALTGGFGVAEIFPSLKILTRLSRMKSKLDMLVGKMDKIFDSIIEEHKMEIDRSSRINEDDALGGGEDILDVLLRLEQSKEVGFHPTVDDIKGLILITYGS
ncbi:premnaspirodiene oxygenase-like [Eucalyptus grandis]|uniref:premnaspirodiene oxygenase-like n=1 Tax=Eucalyptus grandis TaxID=71139 RepID=UPI00192ECF0B|nr:premnaspirodiene oxygenase-like [Eucalyptus grandis]